MSICRKITNFYCIQPLEWSMHLTLISCISHITFNCKGISTHYTTEYNNMTVPHHYVVANQFNSILRMHIFSTATKCLIYQLFNQCMRKLIVLELRLSPYDLSISLLVNLTCHNNPRWGYTY